MPGSEDFRLHRRFKISLQYTPALCVPPGRTPPAERRDDHLRAARVLLLTRGLLEPSSLRPVQGLLLLGPGPQLGAAGPALRRGTHRPRPQLHVLPGEVAACSALSFLWRSWDFKGCFLHPQALLFLFSYLRKVAWDYGRLALVNDTER